MIRFIFLSLLFVFVLCAEKNPSITGIKDQRYYQSLLEEVKSDLAKVRGLNFKRQLRLNVLTSDQFANYNGSNSSAVLDFYSIELKQLGFIPDSMKNFGQQLNSFYNNFAAAFYVPGTDSIYLINPDDADEIELRYYLAHELTHAIQDQNFNAFSNFIYPSRLMSFGNSDFYLANLCVSEGDANLSGDFYINEVFGNMSQKDICNFYSVQMDSFLIELKNTEAPQFLSIRGMSPYILGQCFVGNKFLADGWTGVNSLFHSNRVLSTAEILTFSPSELSVFDFNKVSSLLLDNTINLNFADDDTYGPVMLMALLNKYVDFEHCKNAFGWQGDRILYVFKDNSSYGSFVWALNFNTTQDAAYIINAFDSLLSNRMLSGTLPVRAKSQDSITYTHSQITTTLVQKETSVIWIENAVSADVVAALFDSDALAKTSNERKDYSTLPKNEKWKILKKMMEKNR